jgi:hypothetical protein
MVFYEPGKTAHGLPRDPFKVSATAILLLLTTTTTTTT